MSVQPDGVEAATALILEVFRLSQQLLAAGDRLVAPLDLTSARWQVLGAVAESEFAKPVAWLARDLGMHRQGVQRIVNDLIRQGLVDLAPNPHHRRASLVVLTERGSVAFKSAMILYRPWVEQLVTGLPARDLRAAACVVGALRFRVQAVSTTPGEQPAPKPKKGHRDRGPKE